MFLPQFNPFPQPDPWWKSLQKDIGERQLLRWQNFFFFNYSWFLHKNVPQMILFLLPQIFFGMEKLLVYIRSLVLHDIFSRNYLKHVFIYIFTNHEYLDFISLPCSLWLFQYSTIYITYKLIKMFILSRLHFLSRYFSFLNCSVIMPVSSVEPAATYTQFTKWC